MHQSSACVSAVSPARIEKQAMKITGARNEPFSAMRRRALAQASSPGARRDTPVDSAEFLGISEMEMTPAVKAAIQTLMTEIDDLRGEVGRLKGRLKPRRVRGILADRDALTPLLNRRAFVRGWARDIAGRTFSPSATARRPAWSTSTWTT